MIGLRVRWIAVVLLSGDKTHSHGSLSIGLFEFCIIYIYRHTELERDLRHKNGAKPSDGQCTD
jgi:hypothetical protein